MSLRYNHIPHIVATLDEQLDPAIRKIAQDIANGAQSRVPVDSGNLKGAIHVEKLDDGYLVVAGDEDAWYGHFVERGTQNQPPHPFLMPAAELARAKIDNIVKEALRDLE